MDVTAQSLPISLHEDAMQAICHQYGVRQLALFGSVLREDFTTHSDIDVLCTLQPDSLAKGFQWIALMLAFEDLWGRRVDLIKPQLLDPLIRDEVLKEARTIYVAPS